MSWAPEKYELPQYYDFRSISTVRNTTCIEGRPENITLIYNERFNFSGVSMLDNTFIQGVWDPNSLVYLGKNQIVWSYPLNVKGETTSYRESL